MNRLIWPIVAGAALTLALWASGGSEKAPASAERSTAAARPTSQLAPSPRQVIRPLRPVVVGAPGQSADGGASQRSGSSGEISGVDASALVRDQGQVIRPDRESIMAQRAAEARRLAQERAAMLDARKGRYDDEAAERRQRELAALRQQQNELAAAQSRMLLSGQASSLQRTRTAPTPTTSNLARESRQGIGAPGGASGGESTADQLGASADEVSDAIDAFQEQTAADQAGAGGDRAGQGGSGIRVGDPEFQALIDTLTGAGFDQSTAQNLVSLATGGGGGGGGAAGLIPTATTTLFGSTDEDLSQTGDGADDSGDSTDGGAGEQQDGADNGSPTDNTGSSGDSGGSGGDTNGNSGSGPGDSNTGGDSDGGSTPPPAQEEPPPAPTASLVGVSLNAGAVVGGEPVSASVRIVQAVSVNTTVTLRVDNPAAASAPSSVVIPAGEVSAGFAISTRATVEEQAVRLTVSLASGDARTVLLLVQPVAPPPSEEEPGGDPPPDPGSETEPEGAVIARWIRVPDNDCEDAGPIQPPITLEGFFTNDLFLGFEDPPAVAGAGSPIPLIVDSPPEVGLTIVGGRFFQHPFGGNGPPSGAPQTSDLPSCIQFDSHVTIAEADPSFLPGRSLPLTDWPSPMDAAWFTIRFADAVVEQDAARFGDNRFYIRIARLTAPSGVRVRGVVDALFPGVVDAGGVRVEIPDEPVIWGQFDLNADGLVDAADARALSAEMTAAGGAPRPGADLNGDGAVSQPDMRLLIDAIRNR